MRKAALRPILPALGLFLLARGPAEGASGRRIETVPVVTAPAAVAAPAPLPRLELPAADQPSHAADRALGGSETARPPRRDELSEFIKESLPALERPGGLPLRPGALLEYPAKSPLAGLIHVSDLSLDIRRDASAEELARVAAELEAGGAEGPVLPRLERALAEGGPVSLTPFLPSWPRRLTGRHAKEGNGRCEGPNCFNAALLWQDAEDEPRYATDMELGWRLSYTHRPLAAEATPRFGDVLLIHVPGSRPDAEIAHAARLVGPGYVWHKASQYKTDPWTFESLRGAVSYYWDHYGRRVRLEILRGYRAGKVTVLGGSGRDPSYRP